MERDRRGDGRDRVREEERERRSDGERERGTGERDGRKGERGRKREFTSAHGFTETTCLTNNLVSRQGGDEPIAYDFHPCTICSSSSVS